MAFQSMAEKIIKSLLESFHLSSPTVEQINSIFFSCFVDVDVAFTQTYNNKISLGQSSFSLLITLSSLPLYQTIRAQHSGSQLQETSKKVIDFFTQLCIFLLLTFFIY